jgi:hypothetical protein
VLSFSEVRSDKIRRSEVTVTALGPGITDTGMVHGTGLGHSTRNI